MDAEAHAPQETPLQRLKALSPEEHEALEEHRKLPTTKLIGVIEHRHRIFGLTELHMEEYRLWRTERRVLRQMNYDAAAFREAYGRENPAATFAEAHEATLAHLHRKAARLDSEPLMRFVLAEIRRARVVEQSTERLKMMERRIEILERCSAAARTTLQDETMTDEQRAQRIREVFGLS